MFLDILAEALHKRSLIDEDEWRDNPFAVLRYDGTIPKAKRAATLHEFNYVNRSGTSVLLLTAGCGGTGLNITGGCHMIICERFWSPGLREQVIGRCYRLRQTRTVHIWDMVAPESPVDQCCVYALIGHIQSTCGIPFWPV